MNATTIRALDYWLGVPACALLTGVRAIRTRLRRPTNLAASARQAPRKILFLKFIEQGATVLAQDAIARATAWVGRDNVYFCVFDTNRAIVDLIGTIPPAEHHRDPGPRLLACLVDFWTALRTVRAAGIDTAIDMEFFSRASAIFAFLTAPRPGWAFTGSRASCRIAGT